MNQPERFGAATWQEVLLEERFHPSRQLRVDRSLFFDPDTLAGTTGGVAPPDFCTQSPNLHLELNRRQHPEYVLMHSYYGFPARDEGSLIYFSLYEEVPRLIQSFVTFYEQASRVEELENLRTSLQFALSRLNLFNNTRNR